MLLNALFLLAALAQARSISRRQDDPPPFPGTEVNGTITSFSVLEGNGCPAGTYKTQPIELGKALNTYVDFDSFVYNTNTSPSSLNCGLSIDFEFTYPDDGIANLFISTISSVEGKYDEASDNKDTIFVDEHLISVHIDGEEDLEFPVTVSVLRASTQELNVGANIFPTGTPGELGIGSYKSNFEIYTVEGPGEFLVYRIAIGFGLYELTSLQDDTVVRTVGQRRL
ncbi:hypothetical protein EJ04DRAFT_557484 [Polyplosphaeria fusca]|uniref:Ubiquitin 3 binding protein But2 C-terminal domain-containing protein n=1 Tax=Polyplosphaeria fusca TaxID=682080 RepID=A0A9P4QM16_9PLEO|nr:hypothetical protein EJ04DRAFT_557484 [Polyplosphaeria fusca]